METGKHQKRNLKRLEGENDKTWAAAIAKCATHVRIKLRQKTSFGAHTESRLGMVPIDYYVSYAYDAIISGSWEWKEQYTLAQQMVRIAESTISTEVEKFKTGSTDINKVISIDDEYWFDLKSEKLEPDMLREILHEKKVQIIEESVKGNPDFEAFWECVKDGMRSRQIAEFMEKTPKQVYKIQERFVQKIKESPYFEDL